MGDFLKRWRACSDEKNSGRLLFIIITFYFSEQEVTKLSPETQPHFRRVTKSKKWLVNANVSPYKAEIDKLNIKPREK